jgi:hypothetical protein
MLLCAICGTPAYQGVWLIYGRVPVPPGSDPPRVIFYCLDHCRPVAPDAPAPPASAV